MGSVDLIGGKPSIVIGFLDELMGRRLGTAKRQGSQVAGSEDDYCCNQEASS